MNFIQKYGFILLIVILCTAFTIVGVLKESKTAANSYIEVTIVEGDTLWGLAQGYSQKDSSDKWIAKVMKLNEMESTTIKTGETLKLPQIDPIMPDPMMTELAGEEK